MAKKYLDNDGVLYFWQKIKTLFVPATRTVNGNALSSNITLTASDVGAQETLVSGTNIKTVNGTSLLGSGDIPVSGGGGGTVTSVGVSNATDGGLSVSGSPVTGSGTITVGHSNVLTSAQTTQAVYPIKIDKNGHVSGYGTAVTSMPASDVSSWAKASTKPSYTASEVGAVALTAIGQASGICPLNASTKIDSAYLPSYVDDVVEAYARSGQTALSQNWLSLTSGGAALSPEAGKIYILMADSGDYAANTQFRWGGSAYVKMLDGGVTSITNAEIDTIIAS